MPLLHHGVRYNCRVLALHRQILLIRPKLALADSGNYRESRYFAAYPYPHAGPRSETVPSFPVPTLLDVDRDHNGGRDRDRDRDRDRERNRGGIVDGADGGDVGSGFHPPLTSWSASTHLEPFLLPPVLHAVVPPHHRVVPFGVAALRFSDGVTLGCETCEELFTARPPHIDLALQGVDIIANGSGSHHQLRKLDHRLELMKHASRTSGGVYLYANQLGGDGGRLYFDGCASVFHAGKVVAQGVQFGLQQIECVVATVDLAQNAHARAGETSNMHLGAKANNLPGCSGGGRVAMVDVKWRLSPEDEATREEWMRAEISSPSSSLSSVGISATSGSGLTHPEEWELGAGPACWMWDYLRRSGARGFVLPLSGGADSACTAAMVGLMCQMVVEGMGISEGGAAAADDDDDDDDEEEEEEEVERSASGRDRITSNAERERAAHESNRSLRSYQGWHHRDHHHDQHVAPSPLLPPRLGHTVPYEDRALIALIEREREVHNMTRSRRPGRGRPGLPCQTDRVALIRDVRRVLRLPPVEVDVDVVADDEATTPPDRWMPRLLEGVPTDPRALASMVLTTLYLGQEGSSSEETRDRATRLSHEIGAQFLTIPIHTVTSALLSLFRTVFGVTPTFKSQGGSVAENLALQNIQARVRMVVTFLCAQLLPWVRGQTDGAFLLVLGSANVDECLRGYMTKYDCSSADINPIGGISKRDIRRFLRYRGYGGGGYAYPTLLDIESAPPTAELEPLFGQRPQTDEEDMGMTYADLTLFGIWRKVHRMGPVSMFRALLARETRKKKKKKTPKKEEKEETEREEKKEDSPHQRGGRRKDREGKTHVQEDDDDDEQGKTMAQQVAERVKHFFQSYAINRHKATTLTPSYHAEGYGYVVG